MELTQTHLLPVPLQTAWDALNDPAVLQRCIPGCESVTAATEHAYDIAMTAAVGPVKARFKGRMELADIVPPRSYTLHFDGQGGAAGFGKGTAQVQLAPEGPTVTRLSYTAHAQVGGKLAQIGSRLIDGAARKLADEFFQRFASEFGPAEAPGPWMPPPPTRRSPTWPPASWPRTAPHARRSSARPCSRATRGHGSSSRWWPSWRPTCFCTTAHNQASLPTHSPHRPGSAPWTASISKC